MYCTYKNESNSPTIKLATFRRRTQHAGNGRNVAGRARRAKKGENATISRVNKNKKRVSSLSQVNSSDSMHTNMKRWATIGTYIVAFFWKHPPSPSNDEFRPCNYRKSTSQIRRANCASLDIFQSKIGQELHPPWNGKKRVKSQNMATNYFF